MLGSDVDVHTHRLAVAFWPVDPITQRGGEAELEITWESDGTKGRRKRRAIRNRAGYYCFEDLTPRVHVFRVLPAGRDRERYCELELVVDIATLPALAPVFQIDLVPAPAYPFAPGATLLRGCVENLTSARVANVELALVGHPYRARSDERGVFALAADASIAGAPVDLQASKGAATSVTSVQLIAGDNKNAGVVVIDAE